MFSTLQPFRLEKNLKGWVLYIPSLLFLNNGFLYICKPLKKDQPE